MIDGIYQVEVDTILGRKSGTVELTTHGNVLEAAVDAPILGKQVATGTVEGSKFFVSGSVKILLKGTIEYAIEGEVYDDLLTGVLKTGNDDFIIAGARI